MLVCRSCVEPSIVRFFKLIKVPNSDTSGSNILPPLVSMYKVSKVVKNLKLSKELRDPPSLRRCSNLLKLGKL